MKKLVLSMAVALMALLVSSCDSLSDEDLGVVSMDVNVEGYVFDELTEEPIAGAIISGKFGSTKTNTDGYYSIKGLDMGTYRIEVEAEGYMTMVLTPTFQEKEEDFKGNDFNELLITDMYKANEPISTQLVEVVGPTKKALANMPYTLEFSVWSDFKDRFVYGVTDAKGMITDTIPDVSFDIIVDTVINDMIYLASWNVASPGAENSTYSIVPALPNAMALFIVSTNLVDEDGVAQDEFDKTADIELVFNEAINTEESEFVLYKQVGFSNYEVKVDIQYSNGDKTVTISPSENGSLEAGQSYYLSYNTEMASDENSTIGGNLSFSTAGEVITSLSKPSLFVLKTTINQTTSWINFEADVDLNSTDIEVYGRYVNSEDFVKFDSRFCNFTDLVRGTVFVNGLWLTSLPNIQVPNTGLFSNSNNFEIMFRTYVDVNGERIYSDFSDKVTLKDGDPAQ